MLHPVMVVLRARRTELQISHISMLHGPMTRMIHRHHIGPVNGLLGRRKTRRENLTDQYQHHKQVTHRPREEPATGMMTQGVHEN